MHSAKLQGIEAILFDFGGTLDSDGEHWLDRFCLLYQEAGFGLPLSRIKHAFYETDAHCCGHPALLSAGLRSLMAYHVHLQFKTLQLKDDDGEKAMVHAFCSKSEYFLQRNARLLTRLKAHYRLGVVSNFYGNVAVICQEAGLAESLDIMLDSVLMGVSKPDHRIFRSALAALGRPPSRVAFVGDSYERDITPARELGLKTIWMPGPNPRSPRNTPHVDLRIAALTELLEAGT